jgi:ribonuclease HII
MLPKKKREGITKYIKDSDKFSDKKKEEILGRLEEVDKEAVEWEERIKLLFRAISHREINEWKKKMGISKRIVETMKEAAEEIKKLSPEGREVIKGELAKEKKPKKGMILVERDTR